MDAPDPLCPAPTIRLPVDRDENGSPVTQAAVVIGCLALVIVPALAMRLAPPAAGPVAVFSNPFSQDSAADVVVRSGGQLVRGGAWRWMVIGDSPDPAFRDRLGHEGAWLVTTPVDPSACIFPRA